MTYPCYWVPANYNASVAIFFMSYYLAYSIFDIGRSWTSRVRRTCSKFWKWDWKRYSSIRRIKLNNIIMVQDKYILNHTLSRFLYRSCFYQNYANNVWTKLIQKSLGSTTKKVMLKSLTKENHLQTRNILEHLLDCGFSNYWIFISKIEWILHL